MSRLMSKVICMMLMSICIGFVVIGILLKCFSMKSKIRMNVGFVMNVVIKNCGVSSVVFQSGCLFSFEQRNVVIVWIEIVQKIERQMNGMYYFGFGCFL